MSEHICGFKLAWREPCQKTATDSGRCEEHTGLICCSCGAPATGECNETMELVCGAILCDNCEHTICENGCNSGAPLPDGYTNHCKKDEQIYLPWYMRDEPRKETP